MKRRPRQSLLFQLPEDDNTRQAGSEMLSFEELCFSIVISKNTRVAWVKKIGVAVPYRVRVGFKQCLTLFYLCAQYAQRVG